MFGFFTVVGLPLARRPLERLYKGSWLPRVSLMILLSRSTKAFSATESFHNSNLPANSLGVPLRLHFFLPPDPSLSQTYSYLWTQ